MVLYVLCAVLHNIIVIMIHDNYNYSHIKIDIFMPISTINFDGFYTALINVIIYPRSMTQN